MEDRLFYADDVLLLATSGGQLIKAINIVEEWAKMNGMSLKNPNLALLFLPTEKPLRFQRWRKSVMLGSRLMIALGVSLCVRGTSI